MTEKGVAMSDLLLAVNCLADTFGTIELGHDVGGHMTCGEADAFARVLHIGGHKEAATRFLAGHSFDDEGDGIDEFSDAHAGWGDAQDLLQRAEEYIREKGW